MGSTKPALTAKEKFARIKIKFERAKKHSVDLGKAYKAYLHSEPNEVGVKRDPQTRKPIYYVVRVTPIPDELAVIAADVIHNLRVTLDHMAWQLFLMGPDARPNRDFKFPIKNDAPSFAAYLKSATETLRKDAIEALRSVEPYKGGQGHGLWELNRLNNIDKHRLLVTVGGAFAGVSVGPIAARFMELLTEKVWPVPTVPQFGFFLKPADRHCPLKAGDELFVDSPDAEFNQNMKFLFGVAFNEPGVIDAKAILEAIDDFGKSVSRACTLLKPCLA